MPVLWGEVELRHGAVKQSAGVVQLCPVAVANSRVCAVQVAHCEVGYRHSKVESCKGRVTSCAVKAWLSSAKA